MNIIFSGTIGRSGLGGQAWATLQYLLGLRALGHEVYYLEDCGDTTFVWNWEKAEWNYELDYPAAYVHACLAPFGLGEHWIYRTNSGKRGMPLDTFQEICRTADLLLLRAVPLWVWRPEYDLPRRRAFIDVDPGFTQMAIANGDQGLAEGIRRCDRRFTLAQRLGADDCLIPPDGGPWCKTLPPIFLPEWPVMDSAATHFTSIMRWQGFREENHDGHSFGQRDQQFPKFMNLPERTAQKFLLALMGVKTGEFQRHGWDVVPGEVISRTVATYRGFIQKSRAEFGVPKHGYVKSRGGWFSDRSVCYLACGRPVVVEDTGLADFLPVGEGIVTFADLTSAQAAVESVNASYRDHCRAARSLAEKYFTTERVLPELLEIAMS